jgi:hypothetical protein
LSNADVHLKRTRKRNEKEKEKEEKKHFARTPTLVGDYPCAAR